MQYKTLFIDLDDTVYPAETGLWELIKQRISLYMHEKLGMSWAEIPALRNNYYRNYGTTMRGLMADFDIDKEEYLLFVHNVPIEEYLKPDPELHRALQSLPQKKVIFTNADAPHALRVMNALGITDCFEKTIDILTLFPHCKPLPEAYHIALECAGEKDASRCAFLDDSVSNLAAARQIGFYSIRVGSEETGEGYDAGINRLHDIGKVIK